MLMLMKKFMLIGLLLAGQAGAQAAQDTPASTNPLDVTKYKDIAEGKVLPTPATVAALKAQAEALVAGDKCQEALPQLELWSTQANWLANLIAGGLEPFYSASSSARKDLSSATISVLAPYEREANSYKTQRNVATIMRAECLVKLNKPNEAAAVYLRALDLISASDTTSWSRATRGLYKLIGMPDPAF